MKKQKQKKLNQGFGLKYAYTYIGPAYAAQLYTYTCREDAYVYTPKNPNLEKQEQQNRAETKLANLTT